MERANVPGPKERKGTPIEGRDPADPELPLRSLIYIGKRCSGGHRGRLHRGGA